MANQGTHVVRSVTELRERMAKFCADRETTALVPTMGALHEGHLDLIRHAKGVADRCVVSIFVNPTQFGVNEDFGQYPRNEIRDVDVAMLAGADLIFAPNAADMYPPGHVTRVTIPELGDALEGAHRPGFFTGVATVVTKLLLQVLPNIAVFGEKDFQQLLVISRMVADLDIPVSIHGVATIREADGLALSSRNAYLSTEQRAIAPTLYKVLCDIADNLVDGGSASDLVNKGMSVLMEVGFERPDYIAVCQAETLSPVESCADLQGQPGRILAAARLGKTRLIDNVSFSDRR